VKGNRAWCGWRTVSFYVWIASWSLQGYPEGAAANETIPSEIPGLCNSRSTDNIVMPPAFSYRRAGSFAGYSSPLAAIKPVGKPATREIATSRHMHTRAQPAGNHEAVEHKHPRALMRHIHPIKLSLRRGLQLCLKGDAQDRVSGPGPIQCRGSLRGGYPDGSTTARPAPAQLRSCPDTSNWTV